MQRYISLAVLLILLTLYFFIRHSERTTDWPPEGETAFYDSLKNVHQLKSASLKPLVVLFVSASCDRCDLQIQEIGINYFLYRNDFDLLVVSDDNFEGVKKFAKDLDTLNVQVLKSIGFARRFQITAAPTILLFDKNGVLFSKEVGLCSLKYLSKQVYSNEDE